MSDSGEATPGQDVIDLLRTSGDHPLMYSFPHGAVFAFDHEMRYLSAGGQGLGDVGLSREMLEGRSIFEAFPPETSGIIEPLYRAALGGTVTTYDVPYAGRVFQQRLAPVTDDTGRIVAGLGFTQDVTDTRAAEHALTEALERTRLTFTHAPIGQAIVGLDGSWLQVNAAVTLLTGYPEEELLELTFQDITHPDDLDLDLGHLNRLVAGEIDSYQIEKRYFSASGQVVWVLLSVALVRDEESSPLYFISQIQDISDTKRQHQALQDMTATLAHDLRSPAAVILGLAELLQDDAEADAEQIRSFAARIAAASRGMTELVEGALTAAALDAGQLVASPQEVSIRRAVETAIDSVDLGSVSTDLSGLDDAVAWVDPTHVVQVLSNLLTNAVKYGGDTVTISSTSTPRRVCVSIADNGPGAEADFVPHLFDRFTRSRAARSGRQRGSGLGLHIVRDLMETNGGTARYAVSSAGGAEFILEFPTRQDAVVRGDEG